MVLKPALTIHIFFCKNRDPFPNFQILDCMKNSCCLIFLRMFNIFEVLKSFKGILYFLYNNKIYYQLYNKGCLYIIAKQKIPQLINFSLQICMLYCYHTLSKNYCSYFLYIRTSTHLRNFTVNFGCGISRSFYWQLRRSKQFETSLSLTNKNSKHALNLCRMKYLNLNLRF